MDEREGGVKGEGEEERGSEEGGGGGRGDPRVSADLEVGVLPLGYRHGSEQEILCVAVASASFVGTPRSCMTRAADGYGYDS